MRKFTAYTKEYGDHRYKIEGYDMVLIQQLSAVNGKLVDIITFKVSIPIWLADQHGLSSNPLSGLEFYQDDMEVLNTDKTLLKLHTEGLNNGDIRFVFTKWEERKQ